MTPAAKLVTTMKSARISKQGPYIQPEDESSESESEDEKPSTTRRPSKLRQASCRAIGGFHADIVVKEEEEEVTSLSGNILTVSQAKKNPVSEEESSEEEEAPRKPILNPSSNPSPNVTT
jgi:hypothetical protein